MGFLFSRPKPPKIEIPKEEPPPVPPAPPPPLPPPAKETPQVQQAGAEVKRREARRGRRTTLLTNPLGLTAQGPGAPKTLVGQ